MAGTLAELQDRPAKKRRAPFSAKVCRFCGKAFAPRSGIAAKIRERCYAPRCEDANEVDRRRRAQEDRGR